MLLVGHVANVFAQSPSSDKAKSAKGNANVPKAYSSPKEVYESYRTAGRKGDVATWYRCFLPEIRESFAFEAFFACCMHPDNPKVIAVQKKFNVDQEKFNATFAKLYKAKFGLDYEKADLDYRAKVERAVATRQQVPERPNDLDVRYKAINTLVADRIGFITA